MNRQEIWERHYISAITLNGGSLMGSKHLSEQVHKVSCEHATRALAEIEERFGADETLRKDATEAEHRAATAEAELEKLRQQLADQGEELSAARAEATQRLGECDLFRRDIERLRAEGVRLPAESRNHERSLLHCAEAFGKLAAVLFEGAGIERPEANLLTIGYRTVWEPLIDRARDISTGALAELANSHRELERRTDENITAERNLQKLEGLLDSLWETTHPGQEMADDLGPEEVAHQICEAWAERQQTDREVEAASEATLDGLAALQKRVRELGDLLRSHATDRNNVDPEGVLDCFSDLFGLPAEAGGCSCGAKFTTTDEAHDHECPLDADLALGKQMGDAIAAVVGG